MSRLDEIKKIKDAMKGGDKTTPTSAKVEKVEKTKAGGKTPGHGSLKDNGGKRNGSGRKPLEQDEKRVSIKKSWENYADEDTEVQELHKGTREIRVVKMKRLRVAQERLFKKVMEGDVSAIKEFNDRVGGKAPQTIRGGDEDDSPVQIDVGFDRIIDKVYGDDQ